MPIDRIKFSKQREAFTLIANAWSSGRSIVPLYGAGISIEAGIPSTPQLINYFCRLQFLRDRVLPVVSGQSQLGTPRRPPSDRGLFVSHQWMDQYQLNADLIQLSRDNNYAETIFSDASSSEGRVLTAVDEYIKRGHQEREIASLGPMLRSAFSMNEDQWATALQNVYVEWHSFLAEATGGRQAQIDAFFDSIIRQRTPSRAHFYNACLSQLLDIRTILTTNFDDLLERALRHQGIDPIIHEIEKGAGIPAPEVLTANRSVVKLHGGNHHVRADISLNEELSVAETLLLCQAIPDDALLLVIGYGGSDRRVMAMLETLVDRTKLPRLEKRIVWVHRSEKPGLAARQLLGRSPQRNIGVQYSDGGLFLQEVYETLTDAHPVAKEPYQVLPQLPPWIPPDFKQEGKANDWSSRHSVRVFHSQVGGNGTSTALSAFVDSHKDSHHIIWIDLEEIPTTNAVLTLVYDQLRSVDDGIAPIVLSPLAYGREYRKAMPVYARRVKEALLRGQFILAFDSLGEFANDGDVQAETSSLLQFIQDGSDALRSEGSTSESMIAIARTPDTLHETDTRWKEFLGDLTGRSIVDCEELTENVSKQFMLTSAGFTSSLQAALEKNDADIARLKAQKDSLSQMKLVYSWFDGVPKSLLAYASVFRRPRSVVDLKALFPTVSRSDIEKSLELLVDCRLLVRREGGFYWMYRTLRDSLLDAIEISESDDQVCIWHAQIARLYYRNLYLSSKDISAFLEYVHHGIASAKTSDLDRKARRLVAVTETIARERQTLFSMGHSELLLQWISAVRAKLKEHEDAFMKTDRNRHSYRKVLGKICDLEAALRRDATDYEGCAEMRVDQIFDRLDELGISERNVDRKKLYSLKKQASKEWNLEKLVKFAKRSIASGENESIRIVQRLANHVLDVGVCNKGLRASDNAERWIWASHEIATEIIALDKIAFEEQAIETQIRCAYRMADVHLAGIDPWSRTKDADEKSIKAALVDAQHELEFARELLDRHLTLAAESSARDRCITYTMMARLHYLWAIFVSYEDQETFEEGFRSAATALKNATASLNRCDDLSGMTQLAVCEFHRAESLLFRVKVFRERKDRRWRFEAKSLLNRVALSIERGRKHLSHARKNVWWWTLAYLLLARLYLELIYLSEKGGGIEDVRGTKIAMETWMFECFRACSTGFDNICKDSVRKMRFVQIINELRDLIRPRSPITERRRFDQEWNRLIVRAGIDTEMLDAALNALKSQSSVK